MNFPADVGPMKVDMCQGKQHLLSLTKDPPVPWHVDDFFAQKYGFPVQSPSSRMTPPPMVTEPKNPRILLQSFASFCALLCAADDSGAGVMEHQPIRDPQTFFMLDAFRKEAARVLPPQSHAVLTGMNSPSAEANDPLADGIVQLLAKEMQVTKMLAVQALRDANNIDRIGGMIYVPRQLSPQDTNSLLLLGYKQKGASDLLDEIADVVRASQKP